MGLSDEQEPSAYKLSKIKSIVKQNHLHYIYVESNESNKIATTLANENNMKLIIFNPFNNSDFLLKHYEKI